LRRGVAARFAQEFELRLREWRQELDIAAAEELLAAAIVVGTLESDEIRAAARLIAFDQQSLSGSKDIARSILGTLDDTGTREPLSSETAKMHIEIARRKRLLRMYPRDALLLTETALQCTNLGMSQSAAQLLRAAAAVAPNDRYVLRSLTRFWVHSGDPDRAVHFLSKSIATRSDPWLMAAQMAAEDVAHKAPSFWREAKRILSAERFSSFDLTELAAATGTLQLEAGNHKLARKMFRRSLTAPTENAVAQAQWASRRDPVIEVPHTLTANAFEALAWEKLADRRWQDTIDATKSWQDIEPFSVRPAVMGSFVAVAHLGDGRSGEEFSRKGLIANRGTSVLHNNLAVAMAIQGRVDEASQELENVKIPQTKPEEIVNLATRGLIEMRKGNWADGSELYRRSIELAIADKNAVLWCRAAAHYAYESARYDKSELAESASIIMKVYSSLSMRTKLLLNDVPAILERAAKVQSASEVIEKLASFRSSMSVYPFNDEPPET
jgi:Flp pilus assembly protein TadD